MSKAAELIAGLQTDAQFDSDGSFSLDREKARQKMRQFQLADPHRYVLLLVEAAALRGASTIAFDIDSDDMRMCFDASLSWADLDELYTSLFVDRTSVEIRARRELALACNAVMALNPRWAQIDSCGAGPGAGAGGRGEPPAVRAILRPDTDDEITKLDAPPDAPEGMVAPWTTVHVKERFRPGLLVRFLKDISGTIPEEALIRTGCRHASVAISLDGARVSEGLPTDLVARVEFSADGLRGVAGIASDENRRDRSVVVLLSNGVEIATHELSESVDGLWFWVDSARFRKDVSQGDVVRSDPSYEAMLRAIGLARDRVLGELVTLWERGTFKGETTPTDNQVFDLLRKCFLRWADTEWLRADAGPLGHLTRLPLWRSVDHRWLSPAALVEGADKLRGIMYTERDFDGVTPQGWGPVVHVLDGDLEIAALQRVYPDSDRVTKRLEREVPWELARRAWRARPHGVELPRGNLRHPISFEQDDIQGRAALRPGQLSDIRVVVDGCLLCELQLDLGYVGMCAVLSGPFTPKSDYSAPRQDRRYATGLMLLLGQLPLLLQAWAEDDDAADMLQRWVIAVTRPQFTASWLTCFGFSETAAKQLVERIGEPPLVPPLGLGEGQVASAVARQIRFTSVDGRRVTLVEVEHDRRTRERAPGKVLIVQRSAPTSEAVAELLLHVSDDDLRVLGLVFGADAIVDDTRAYKAELGRRRFEAKPQRQPGPPSTTWTVSVEVGEGADLVRGHVGIDAGVVRDWQADKPRRASVEVLTRDRALCRVEERTWVPGVEAQLAWAAPPVNRDWDAINGSHRPLRTALDAGVIQIIRALATTNSAARPSEDVRRLLWLAIASPFVSNAHFRAWRAIRADFGDDHEAAVAGYFEIMELFPGIPLAELREAITLLLDEGKVPSAAALLDLLERDIRPPGGGREFHREVLASIPLLESVPMLMTVSGAAIGLRELADAVEAEGELAYVEDQSLHFETDERVIVKPDSIDRVGLIRLFGREAFSEVSGWIHERRSLQAFEARGQLEHLRVPDPSRLVGVEFEEDGFRGELAIPDWTAGEGQLLRLTFCHDRRVVEELELHAALPVLGIVDDAEAELDDGYTKVNQNTARMAALRRLLDNILADELLPKLADSYADLDPRQRSLARTWIATHWRRASPRAGQHENRLTDAGHKFAALKLFRDVDGSERSLAELSVRYREQRVLWFVERHPGHTVEPPFPIVEARDADLRLLGELFSDLQDFSDRWRAREAGEARRRRAAPLPAAQAPAEALHEVTVSRHDMDGKLWIPAAYAFDAGVIYGAEGKVVEVARPSEWLPVQGCVGGFAADDAFEHAELTSAQRRYIESRVIFLYSGLLNNHRRELERPEATSFMAPENARRRSNRFEVLRAAAVSQAKAELQGEGFDAILGNLFKRLIDEPLLRLASGRRISVAVARKARPNELAHLDIWDPAGPALSAHERARLLLLEDGQAPAAEPPAPEPEDEVELKSFGEVAEGLGVSLGDDEPDAGLKFEFSATDLEVMEEDLHVLNQPPKLEPPPEPEPEPEPDYVGELLERVRDELRLLRERHEITLGEGLLDCIYAEPGRGEELVWIDEGVHFDSAHPRFERALHDPDPIWVSFLASIAYTGLNRWLDEVTDDDELAFHGVHASHLLSGLLGEAE